MKRFDLISKGSGVQMAAQDDNPTLTRLDVVGPLLATATGDDGWLDARAELITGGKSNLTYLVTSVAGELVMRRPPSGAVLATAHDMGREARIQKALASTAVPVAEVVLEDDGAAFGVPFYVMRKVNGAVVRDVVPDSLASDIERQAISFRLADTLAHLHAIEPSSVGLSDFGRPNGFLERQVKRWLRQWDASGVRSVPAVSELHARLSRTRPVSPQAAIVHGDFRLDNCIIDTDRLGIAAVLDWELSTVGDPLTDVGMFVFYWESAGALIPNLVPVVTDQRGFPSADELVGRWSERTGVPLDNLDWYHAFAHFKFAVIAAGIDARVKAGAMSGQDFGDLTSTIEVIAESGLQLVSALTSHTVME